MKLRSKMLMGFGILIIILVGIAIYTLVFLSNTNGVISFIVDKRFQTDKIVQESNSTIMKIHSDIWDAMLFGKGARDIKVTELQADAKTVYENIRKLKELIPEKAQALDSLNSLFRSYFVFGSTILEYKDIIEFNKNIDTVNKFKSNKLDLIDILNKTSTSSSQEFSTSLVELKRTFQLMNVFMLVLTVIAVFAGLVIAMLISRSLTKPIYNLVDTMKEVEKDNYDVQAKVSTKDEIGKLSITFNNMTKQIKLSRENLKDQERLKKEMEIAEKIQTSLCPLVPKYDDLEIAASMYPAEEVGGDYYDLLIDDNKNLWIAIGDVSSHGVSPGLVMMMAETAFNSFVKEKGVNSTPRDAIISVNRVLTENIRDRLKEKHFMTMNFLKYNGSGKFTHAGSHVDIIVYRSKTKTCELYPTSGIYLGIVPDISANTLDKTFSLNLNDVMVVYTDGIIESRQKDNIDNLFGIDALQKVIIANGGKPTEAIMNAIKVNAMDWCGNKPDDDMSMVVVKRRK
jgi:serine phosphatase RsbU (regulator of sigma subunit)